MDAQFQADLASLIIGMLTIGCSIAIEAPQLISIFKTKNTSGTSLFTYILFLLASILWSTWAWMFYFSHLAQPDVEVQTWLHKASMLPSIISNMINLCLVAPILFCKVHHLLLCKKLNVSELDLSKIKLKEQNLKVKGLSKRKTWLVIYWKPALIVLFSITICCLTACLLLFLTTWMPNREFFDLMVGITFVCNAVAAGFFEATSWPQLIKCIKYKNTSGISLGWAIFFPTSCLICFLYDLSMVFTSGEYISVLASLICSGLIVNTLVLAFKLRNIYKAKKAGMTEIEYTNKFLSSKKVTHK